MKKNLISVIAVFLIANCFHSQAQTAAKSVYFEIGGPGLASVNFDTRFTKKEDGIGGRIGVGGFSIDGTSVVLLPIGLNYILSKDQKNYFELGAGVTPVFSNDKGISSGNFETTFGNLIFGYRLQPRNGGFMFRAFINPVFGKGFFLPYYAGVSVGYKF